MKFILTARTQFEENYGAHAWEGKGECPQYWKCKGGEEIVLAKLDVSEASVGKKGLEKIVNDHKHLVEYKNDYEAEYLIGWEIESEKDWKNRHFKEQRDYERFCDKYTWPKHINKVLEDREKSEERHKAWMAKRAKEKAS
jgi:hypothetical protein